ncbi:trypsin-like peptidase domain-containing protein [Lichenihabitans sp. Uapishka_5]|uniref:trypsin-like serine peptidase n=1 Tax=Lichenihabitans sp. Uapishka_5 TaxID=3037302 RepID=UPI0029E7E90C|nr:trypsin-like peptidase domain-containing protein [Lichenihabitans sp. Uapishka_5]MDX7952821.1 trypsin-like peptidase domain-containing protein [Lichenihabitans sp. Uapishka_5]
MSSTADYPYGTIALVQDTIGGQTFEASGVLISPDELLTASHVVYTEGVGTATSIYVAPGYNNGSEPYGVVTGTSFHYNAVSDANDLISLASSQSDYAVIHLSRPVSAGTMQLASDVNGGPVNVTGYPGTGGGAQVTISETVTKDPNYSLLDGVDTAPGSSGSPLWQEQNGLARVIGLVSSGDGTNGYSTQITAAAAAQIRSWVYQDDFPSPLIDVPYYLQANQDVEAAGASAVTHYNNSGWHEGRNPDPLFSTNGYLDTNPDVASAGVNPVTHYDQTGWREGRDPSADFSTALYELRNPDVAAAGVDPLLHYEASGWHEGRDPSAAFSTTGYEAANGDVAAAGVDPLQHFLVSGAWEGRNPVA